MTTRSFNENRSRALVKGYNYYDLYFFFLHFQTFYIINILKRITEGHFVGHDAFIFITRTMNEPTTIERAFGRRVYLLCVSAVERQKDVNDIVLIFRKAKAILTFCTATPAL